jgi:hypothetical protein
LEAFKKDSSNYCTFTPLKGDWLHHCFDDVAYQYV